MKSYKEQDPLLKSKHTMITSELVDDVIIIYIYTDRFYDKNNWFLIDSFDISREQFNALSDRMSYLLSEYIRELCAPEAIHERIHDRS